MPFTQIKLIDQAGEYHLIKKVREKYFNQKKNKIDYFDIWFCDETQEILPLKINLQEIKLSTKISFDEYMFEVVDIY